jgi:hypothetical protein
MGRDGQAGKDAVTPARKVSRRKSVLLGGTALSAACAALVLAAPARAQLAPNALSAGGRNMSAARIAKQTLAVGHGMFSQIPHSGVRTSNAGNLTVQQAGLAALVAPQMAHSGVIQATLSRVILGGAATFTLDLYGDGLLALNVTQQVRSVMLHGRSVPALATNQGTILAEGGTVSLSAAAADGLIRTLVDTGGTIAGRSHGSNVGRVLAQGVGGSVSIEGDVAIPAANAGARAAPIAAGPPAANATSAQTGDFRFNTARAGPGGVPAATLGNTGLAAVLAAGEHNQAGNGGTTALSRNAVRNLSLGKVTAGHQTGHLTVDLSGNQVVQSSCGAMTDCISYSSFTALAGGGKVFTVTNGSITFDDTAHAYSANIDAQVRTVGSGDFVIDPGVHVTADRFSIDAIGRIMLLGNLTATGGSGLIALTAGSSISEGSTGTMSAGTLTVSANGAVTLDGANTNAIGTISSLETGSATLSLLDSAAVTVTGLVSAPGGVALTAASIAETAAGTIQSGGGAVSLSGAGGLDLGGLVLANGGLSLAASGADIAEHFGGATGTLIAATLTGSAGNNMTLDGANNRVGMLGNLAAGGASLTFDDTGPLTVTGIVSAHGGTSEVAVNTTGTGGMLTIAGTLSAATVSLAASQDIAETAGGKIEAGLLDGHAAGNAVLLGTTNGVGTLGAFTAGGEFELFDSQALSVSGGVIAGTTLKLVNGTANATLGVLSGGSLRGGTLLLQSDNFQFDGAVAGTVVALDRFSAGTLVVGGPGSSFGAGGLAQLAAGTLVLGSLDGVAAGKTSELDINTGIGGAVASSALGLFSTGAINAPAAVLAVADLFGSAGGAALLTGSNTIGTLGNFTAAGFTLADSTGLVLGGRLNAGSLASLAIGGNLSEGSAATVTATSLTGSAAGAITLGSGSNDIGSLDAFAAGTSLLLVSGKSLDVVGAVSAGTNLALEAGLSSGTLSVLATGSLAAATVQLEADHFDLAGAVDGSAAVALDRFSSGTLTIGGAGSSLGLAGLTQISAPTLVLGSLNGTAAGHTSELDIAGPIGGMATGALGLFSTGTIVEAPAAVISVATVFGSAGGSALLVGANQIGTLGMFSARGFTLTNAQDLAIAGALQGGASVDLMVSGALTETGAGAIAATSLTGSASGLASLGGSNVIGTLAAFTADGFALTDSSGLTIGGALNAGSSASLTIGGSLVETGSGAIIATSLSGSASGAVTLGLAGNQLGTLSGFSFATDFTLNDSQGLTVAAPLQAAGGGGTISLIGPALTVAATGSLAGNQVSLRADMFDLVGGVSAGIVGLDRLTAGTLSVGGAGNNFGTAGLTSVSAGTLLLGRLDALQAGTTSELDIGPGVVIAAANASTALGLFSTGAIVEDPAASLQVPDLFGNAGGSASFAGMTNQIGTLGAFTAGGFSLTNAQALVIADSLSGGASVALFIAGDLTESGAGAIAAASLTGSVGGATSLDGANAVGTLSAFAANGFAFSDTNGLVISGALNAGPSAAFAITGDLTESTGGAVSAASLSGSVSGAATLNGGNLIATLGDFSAAGFALTDESGLDIAGALSSRSMVNLVISGNIAQTGAGAISTSSLTGSVSGMVALGGANSIATLAAFSANGFALTDTSGVVVTGALDAGPSAKLTIAGNLAESGAGAIAATSLNGSVSGMVSLTGANRIETLGDFSAPSFAFTDMSSLDVTGRLDGGRQVVLTIAGDLTESGTGAITAAMLTGNVTGSMALNGNNAIASLGAVSAGSDLVLDDAVSLAVSGPVTAGGLSALTIALTGANNNLTLEGTLSGGAVSLSAPGSIAQSAGTINAEDGLLNLASVGGTVSMNGTLQVAGGTNGAATLSLSAAGAITEAQTGVIDAARLTAASLDAITLAGATNQIESLGPVSASSAILVMDSTSLSVTGPVQTSQAAGVTVAVTGAGNGLTLAGNVTAGSETFTAAGDITQTAGIVQAVAGGISAASAGGSIGIAGALDAAGLVSLTARAAMAETGSGSIAATTLAGAAGAAMTLGGNNRITEVGALTAGGALLLTDITGLTINGPVTAAPGATLSIAVNGTSNALTVDGALNAGSIDLQAAGDVTASATAKLMAGAGNLNMSSAAGSIVLAGLLSASGSTALAAGNTITETGNGLVQAATLSASAGGAVSLGGANVIATLGDVGAASFVLNDTRDLTVAGTVNAGSGAQINDARLLAVSGSITADVTNLQANAIDATGALTAASSLSLVAVAGGIDVPGSITTSLLTANAPGAASFTGSNHIAAIGDLAAAGITISDAESVNISGAVTSTGNGGLSLTDTAGAIAETGSISASVLTGSAATTASFSGSNKIASLGDFLAGSFSLDDLVALTISGALHSAGGATLSVQNLLDITGSATAAELTLTAQGISIPGSVSASDVLDMVSFGEIGITASGFVSAATVTASTSGGPVDLIGLHNQIGALGNISAASGIDVNDAASLSVPGVLLAGAGNIVIDTPALSLTGSLRSGGSIALTAASNLVQTSGDMTARRDITLEAHDTILLGGALTAPTILVGVRDKPRTVVLDNTRITTGTAVKPGAQHPVFPMPGLGSGGFYVQAGNINQMGTMRVSGIGGGGATVDLALSGAGVISLDPNNGIIGPDTELFLDLDHGTAHGHLEVAGLTVRYALPPNPVRSELTGTIGGVGGEAVAGRAFIVPEPNISYRLNACALSSVNCILLSPVIVPVGSPIQTIDFSTPHRREADDDLLLPNVSEDDF